VKIFKRLIERSNLAQNVVSLPREHLEYLTREIHTGYFSKYSLLLESLLSSSMLNTKDIYFIEDPVESSYLYLVHTRDYIGNIEETLLFGDYIFEDVRMDSHLYEIIRIFCNATLQSSYIALEHHYSMVLGGGFHHAKSDKPGGYCVLNDVAIAACVLLNSQKVSNVLVIDLDVHQGDGTASIFRDIDSVFTFSIHQEDNFPYEKQAGSLDISISSSDFKPKIYLYNLKNSLNSLAKDRDFDIIFYIAGADTLSGDRLGSFSLNLHDLKKRDSIVVKYARDSRTPIVVLMGGGYNVNIGMEIEAYKSTLSTLRSIYS